MDENELSPSVTALPADDVDRVVALLEESGTLHADLRQVLSEPDPDRVIDDLFRDEIHDRRA